MHVLHDALAFLGGAVGPFEMTQTFVTAGEFGLAFADPHCQAFVGRRRTVQGAHEPLQQHAGHHKQEYRHAQMHQVNVGQKEPAFLHREIMHRQTQRQQHRQSHRQAGVGTLLAGKECQLHQAIQSAKEKRQLPIRIHRAAQADADNGEHKASGNRIADQTALEKRFRLLAEMQRENRNRHHEAGMGDIVGKAPFQQVGDRHHRPAHHQGAYAPEQQAQREQAVDSFLRPAQPESQQPHGRHQTDRRRNFGGRGFDEEALLETGPHRAFGADLEDSDAGARLAAGKVQADLIEPRMQHRRRQQEQMGIQQPHVGDRVRRRHCSDQGAIDEYRATAIDPWQIQPERLARSRQRSRRWQREVGLVPISGQIGAARPGEPVRQRGRLPASVVRWQCVRIRHDEAGPTQHQGLAASQRGAGAGRYRAGLRQQPQQTGADDQPQHQRHPARCDTDHHGAGRIRWVRWHQWSHGIANSRQVPAARRSIVSVAPILAARRCMLANPCPA